MTNTLHIPDLAERVAAALTSRYAQARTPFDYALEIPLRSHEENSYPYAFVEDLPESLHAYIEKKSYGAQMPAFKDGRIAYWFYDIKEWLEALGVEVIPIRQRADNATEVDDGSDDGRDSL